MPEPDETTGQAIVAFVTMEGGGDPPEGFDAELREHVGEKIGKLARPKRFIWADDLPKTRSGKIMRRLLRDIAAGHELGDVTTLRDPTVMEPAAGKVAERQCAGGLERTQPASLVDWGRYSALNPPTNDQAAPCHRVLLLLERSGWRALTP